MTTLPPFAQANLNSADFRAARAKLNGTNMTPDQEIAFLKLQIERFQRSYFDMEVALANARTRLAELEEAQQIDDSDLMTTIHALSASHDDEKLADLLFSLDKDIVSTLFQYVIYLREQHGICRTASFIKQQWDALLDRSF